MTEKKGIELPGKDGRWEEVPHLSAPWQYTAETVIFRRLPEPEPMPYLRMHDAVKVEEEDRPALHLVVTKPNNRGGVTMSGAFHFFEEGDITEVWRDGLWIWRKQT